MQAVGTKNRTSLHSIDGSAFKTRGSLSIGRGGHVRKRRRGSLSFGISSYLNSVYSKDGIVFRPCGGSDSFAPDIVVEQNGMVIAQMEVKMPEAQCGQFVVFPNHKNKSFYYSPANHPAQASEASLAIISEMNKNFEKYKKPSPKEMGLDTELYYNRVVDYYLNYKKCGFFITRETPDSGEFIIFPTIKFRDYFSISACYRKKRSGSHNPSPDETNVATSLLSSQLGLTVDRGIRVRENGKTYTDLVIPNASEPLYKIETPTRLQVRKQTATGRYRLTMLATTENPNVIFSIRLTSGQDPEDLNVFKRSLSL